MFAMIFDSISIGGKLKWRIKSLHSWWEMGMWDLPIDELMKPGILMMPLSDHFSSPFFASFFCVSLSTSSITPNLLSFLYQFVYFYARFYSIKWNCKFQLQCLPKCLFALLNLFYFPSTVLFSFAFSLFLVSSTLFSQFARREEKVPSTLLNFLMMSCSSRSMHVQCDFIILFTTRFESGLPV